MRSIALVSLILWVGTIATAPAQDAVPPPDPLLKGDEPPQPQSGIPLGGSPLPPSKMESCVDVQIGADRSFGCLNQKLKQQVDKTGSAVSTAPLDAKSSDIHIGIVNIPAVREQYGKNFGKSVIPYRPAPLIYGSPLH